MNNGDFPVYPLFVDGHVGNMSQGLNPMGTSGLTKREHFAGLAMQGLLANPEKDYLERDLAAEAISFADALLTALSNNKDTE